MKLKAALFKPGFIWILFILLCLLLASVLLSITFGNADISIAKVYGVIFFKLFGAKELTAYSQGAVHDVVWLIRLPRVLLALAVGMGLSVCGVVMQAVVKNQLADTYIMGISSGAYMGATIAILFGLGTLLGKNAVGTAAFLGAILSSFAVLIIANMGGAAGTGKLILTGTAVSSICTAFSNFAIYMANNKNATAEIVFWTMGSLAGAGWSQALLLLPVMAAGTLIFWFQYRNLNLLLLGDEAAITLGANLYRSRIIYLILTALLVGLCVNVAGMIGFVGLVIPHAVRMLIGTDHRRVIPVAALAGGIFLIWADVLCRILLKNAEMPVGILVSMIGAPCFIYLLLKRSYGFSGGHL